jgi:hypothetical protein
LPPPISTNGISSSPMWTAVGAVSMTAMTLLYLLV